MDEELDEVFSAEMDEEFGRNLPGSEQPDITQNQDPFFSNRFDIVVPEDDGKKDNCCVNYLKKFWATRNKKILQDKETIIRTTVQELLIYAGFITIILTKRMGGLTHRIAAKLEQSYSGCPNWAVPVFFVRTYFGNKELYIHLLILLHRYGKAPVKRVDPVIPLKATQTPRYFALLPTAYLQTYFFTDVVQQFAFPLESSDKETFTKIHDRPAMWNFILSDFLNSLYKENAENRLVGRPRIRQVRVSSIDCQLPRRVPDHLRHCFPTFSAELENRDPIVPTINKSVVLSKPAWRWRSASESGIDSVPGTIATYTGSGYYLDLGLTRQVTSEMLTELHTNLWTGESTRAVIIDFTLYNANLNFFSVVQLLFETPYTGGVIGSVDIHPLYLIHRHSLSEYVVFVCEIISLVFVAYYIIFKMGLSYFRGFWHLVDFLVISLCVACVGLNIYNRSLVMGILRQGISSLDVYPEFVHIAHMALQYKRLLALLVFFSLIQVNKMTFILKNEFPLWKVISNFSLLIFLPTIPSSGSSMLIIPLQIFKFISFSETMGQLTATINYALYDMIGFTVMFGIIFAAFVQAGTLMFGSTSSEFKSFDLSAFALYRIILGDFDMDAIKATHILLGPLYFLVYVFFVFFVLLNMFLAIIGEAYAKVKENMAKRKNDFKFIAYIRHNTKEFFARFSKRRRMPLDKVLESAVDDQMELSFNAWRRAMKAAGYSEMEANFLFHKYDKDGDNMLDFVERRRMREEMFLGIAFQPADSDDEDNRMKSSEKTQQRPNKDLFAELEDCEELTERIADVEGNVNAVVKQICFILDKLQSAERHRRENEHILMKSIL
ncbi:Polycystin-2 [Echinococcus granulosus]|uniref:Polycystin-2 n=1 Tax=Echinococcus granulosus TaxID=6210 RepID=W6U8P5_ECHGR|nr:Polycystin-2 [Echinococcus granulosus]EUB56801.1 Polycystin-2 [Echinococcus granulosus]